MFCKEAGASIEVAGILENPDMSRLDRSLIARLPAFQGLTPDDLDRAIAAASQRLGAGFRYTEYPGVEHNAWDATYRNPAMWQWMFSQRRQ